MRLRIFIDSDVIISSLISPTGAANFLINNVTNLDLFLTNFSVKELEIIAERLSLDIDQLREIIKQKFNQVELKGANETVKENHKKYVLDINDAHIVAGAKEAKARFLISYNLKHYKADFIKEDFGIIVLTPAQFIQYLRSI